MPTPPSEAIAAMNHLPYRDTKPTGAADFYFAINATFRFLLQKFHHEGFVRWLQDMGRDYFAPVNHQWLAGGLGAVAAYWRGFFAAEPGASVAVHETPGLVTITVSRCPAIAHLRQHGREPVREFCQHCYYLNQTRAAEAGLSMTVEGGNGSCIHRYAAAGELTQDLTRIKEAT